MKCCGRYCLTTSEHIFCDSCGNMYPIYEFDIKQSEDQLNSYISSFFPNICEEFMQRNFVSIRSRNFLESKISFVKNCIYTKDCQIMSLLYISICKEQKLVPIKFFFDRSALMCSFNLFKKCVKYFLDNLSIFIDYKHENLLTFYSEFISFNHSSVSEICKKIENIDSLNLNFFAYVPLGILYNRYKNNFNNNDEINLISSISGLSINNIKKIYVLLINVLYNNMKNKFMIRFQICFISLLEIH